MLALMSRKMNIIVFLSETSFTGIRFCLCPRCRSFCLDTNSKSLAVFVFCTSDDYSYYYYVLLECQIMRYRCTICCVWCVLALLVVRLQNKALPVSTCVSDYTASILTVVRIPNKTLPVCVYCVFDVSSIVITIVASRVGRCGSAPVFQQKHV
jgi:hypothetical protein